MSNYTEFVATQELLRYASPILLTVGTFGSVFTILVLRRKPLKQVTTTFYLMTLAFADLAVLYISLLRIWLEKVYHVPLRLRSNFNCKFLTFISYCSVSFSIWIVVAVTVDRCVLVSFATAARRWCNLRNACRVVIVLALVNILSHLHLLWTVELIYTGKYTPTGKNFSCFNNNPHFKFFNDRVLPWISSFEMCFVPFAIILTSNYLIIRQLAVSARNLRAQRQLTESDTDNKHLRTWSIKSIFSGKRSLAGQIRNRKVQSNDICHKQEANKNTGSIQDRLENQSISMFSSSHVTEQQAALQMPESIIQNNSESGALTSSMLVFGNEKENEFENKCECGELSLQNPVDIATTSILPLPLRDQPRAQQMCHSPTDVAQRKWCGVPNITLFVLIVSSLSCILYTPGAAFIIYSPLSDPNKSEHEQAKMELWWVIGNLTCFFNNAIHFFLYCLTVRRFRQEIVAMFRCARSDPLPDSVRSHT